MKKAREICRELYGPEREQALYDQYRDLDEYIEASLSDQAGYQCNNCNCNQCTVQLMQTRSADEGMTAYIVCPHCKQRRPFK